MKKKIALKDLKVSSFVTEIGNNQSKNVKGGADLPETLFSCMAFVSCNPLDCIEIEAA